MRICSDVTRPVSYQELSSQAWLSCNKGRVLIRCGVDMRSDRQTACPATTAAQVRARHRGDRINKDRNSNHFQTAPISHSDHTFSVAHLDYACTVCYWIILSPLQLPPNLCRLRWTAGAIPQSAQTIKPRSGGMQYGLTLQQPLMSNGAAGQNLEFHKTL